MIKLPDKKGEKVALWEAYDKRDEGPYRIVAISDGSGRWSLATESGLSAEEDWDEAEEWSDGNYYRFESGAGVSREALRSFMIELGLALRGYNYLTMEVKPVDPTFKKSGENLIAKIRGNRCLYVADRGSDQSGEPILELYTNKPMGPSELISSMFNLARALDEYEAWRGG